MSTKANMARAGHITTRIDRMMVARPTAILSPQASWDFLSSLIRSPPPSDGTSVNVIFCA
ncbi:MAG: hypothetical protein ACFFBS_08005 [Promethearchaeota archaeon]